MKEAQLLRQFEGEIDLALLTCTDCCRMWLVMIGIKSGCLFTLGMQGSKKAEGAGAAQDHTQGTAELIANTS